MKDEYDWMSEDQRECYHMLCDLMYGEHHVYAKVKRFGLGIEANMFGCWASYDFNALTRAVVMAHDRMIRVELMPSGPGRVKIALHKRHVREGASWDRHPTLEEHVKQIRGAQ